MTSEHGINAKSVANFVVVITLVPVVLGQTVTCWMPISLFLCPPIFLSVSLSIKQTNERSRASTLAEMHMANKIYHGR